jgi:hypothetical protein
MTRKIAALSTLWVAIGLFALPASRSGTAHAEWFKYQISNVDVGCTDQCCMSSTPMQDGCCETMSCCCPSPP